MKVGQFTPFITKSIQQHHMRRLNAQRAHNFAFKNIVNQQELGDDETVHTLQNDFLSVSDMNMGNLSFEAPSDEELNKVGESLSKLSSNILDALKKRINVPEYIELGSQVFVETKWFNGKENTIFVQKPKEVINKLLISMPSTIHTD